MTFLVERLAELQRYLTHAKAIRHRVADAAALDELGSRRGVRVETYKEAIRGLSSEPGFSSELVAQLEPLAGFRNIVVHEYIGIDAARVIDALHQLDRIEQFLEIVRRAEP